MVIVMADVKSYPLVRIKMSYKQIIFIRHGQQNSKLCNVDVPLSDKGVAQAELLKERLSKEEPFDSFYTSVLSRAVETGDIINQALKMDIIRRASLNEIDWGILAGRSDDEMKALAPLFLKERVFRLEDTPFPQGESGEQAYLRAVPVLKEIATSSAKRILIVSHGGLIRALISGLLGLPFKDKLAFSSTLENTSITEFRYNTETELYTLERLNDYAHLAQHPELLRANWKK